MNDRAGGGPEKSGTAGSLGMRGPAEGRNDAGPRGDDTLGLDSGARSDEGIGPDSETSRG